MIERVGFDFGTTNSAMAIALPGSSPFLVNWSARPGAPTTTGRSVLFFHPERRDARQRLLPFAGPAALAAYLEALEEGIPGRLMQSLKSHLASRTFTRTSVFGTSYDLSELISLIIRSLVQRGREQLPSDFAEARERGGEPGRGAMLPTPQRELLPRPTLREAVVGRPVRFAAATTPEDDAFAESRLREAFLRAGVESVTFEYEPVAAAHFYESRLNHDELVLIADFGGGTSDFSLVRVGPGARLEADRERILGTSGVALAGDAFDRRIVEHVVAPRLGLGTFYRAAMGTNRLPVPAWVYQRLRAWHHLSFLKTPETLHQLREVLAGSEAPEAITALMHLVEADLGYAMYAAVERAKAELSRAPETRLRFADGPLSVDAVITRSDFESWVAPALERIFAALDEVFATSGVTHEEVDAVFLTGGTAFVPALRQGFVQRFGEHRLRGGDELTSVAVGLALRPKPGELR